MTRTAGAHGRSGDRPARWILGAVALALALRLPYASLPLGVDEGGIAYVAAQWGAGGASLYGPNWLDRPPLLVALFRLAEPGGELGIRALGALAAVALVVIAAATARALAGDRAARTAAVLAAALGGSVAIMAAYAPGELLAAVPSAAAVLCLVRAHRDPRARRLVAAGAFAATALLVKQSFLDAAVAGAAFVVASSWPDARLAARRAAAFGAGLALPLAAVAAWQALAGLPAGAVLYALVGFRIDALQALGGTDPPFGERLSRLVAPALGSGLVLLAPVAVAGIARLRAQPALAWTAAAWLAAGGAGVLGGGSYWAHYLIQLVPACSVLGAVAVVAAPRARRRAVVAAVAGTVVLVNAAGVVRVNQRTPYALEVAAAGYVREHARPGDTQYVLYARANVVHYVGLPSPFPYHWSLMVRTVPGATDRLRELLASPRRPTWLVQWQAADAWDLDPAGRTRAIVAEHYRRAVTTLCGRSVHVWLRRDDPRRVPGRAPSCPSFPPAGGAPAPGSRPERGRGAGLR